MGPFYIVFSLNQCYVYNYNHEEYFNENFEEIGSGDEAG